MFHKDRVGKILFYCYCVLMLWLLYGQRIGDSVASNVNLIPLKTIRNYYIVLRRTTNVDMLRHIVVNLAGNVIMFVPLGFFLPLNWKCFRSFGSMLFGSILIICVIELIQRITALGSLDIDDLILNLLGSVVGYAVWFIFRRIKTT